MQFAWEGVNAWVSLLDFNFPDWQTIVPQSFKDEVWLPARDSLSAIKRAEIFAVHGACDAAVDETGLPLGAPESHPLLAR